MDYADRIATIEKLKSELVRRAHQCDGAVTILHELLDTENAPDEPVEVAMATEVKTPNLTIVSEEVNPNG